MSRHERWPAPGASGALLGFRFPMGHLKNVIQQRRGNIAMALALSTPEASRMPAVTASCNAQCPYCADPYARRGYAVKWKPSLTSGELRLRPAQ